MTLRRLSGNVSGTSAWLPRSPSIPPPLERIDIKTVLGILAPKQDKPAKQAIVQMVFASTNIGVPLDGTAQIMVVGFAHAAADGK